MILTIDVGLKNLSLCIMNASNAKDVSTYEIMLWDVYNIMEGAILDFYCPQSLKSKDGICGKKCKFKYTEQDKEFYCCKKHFPKSKKITKQNMIIVKKISNFLLQDIVKILLLKFETIYNDNIDIFLQVKEVYIELQPKINQKMKMISHILFGKIIDLYKDSEQFFKIRFVSASKKLRAYKGPVIECDKKSKYGKRKWLSIQYTKWFLENEFSEEQRCKWLDFLNQNKKSDDIADTFLMCINAIKQ